VLKFTINGKSVNANELGNALMEAAAKKVGDQLHERLSSIRHPITGEFPTVLVAGNSLQSLSVRVEGSAELLDIVKTRFNPEDLNRMTLVECKKPPKAFLSFAWENHALAERVAKELQANGIDTWWAEWSLRAGDSLRQKIEEGLGECTHFIVLLTPESIHKPWVNQEMDAGLVRKLESQVRFIALRSRLFAADLPLLLKGLLSPSIDDFDSGIKQLIHDIHEISRKPDLGEIPSNAKHPQTGYSPAATAIARVFSEDTETGTYGDPQYATEELTKRTGLSEEDVSDGLHELRSFVDARYDRVFANGQLFAEFDKYFKEWNPADDALILAADMVNDPDFPGEPQTIAGRYGWLPRRLNPAIEYLKGRRLIRCLDAIGTYPWATALITKIDETRRFVKSRLGS